MLEPLRTQHVNRISEKLQRTQAKQAEAEKEVRAFEQRTQLEQKLTVTEILLKFAYYQDIFNRYAAAKQTKTLLTNEVKELEAKNKPFKESKARLKDIVKACEKQQEALQKKGKLASRDATSKQSAFIKLVRLFSTSVSPPFFRR
jgi:chromosome segregation ATPase